MIYFNITDQNTVSDVVFFSLPVKTDQFVFLCIACLFIYVCICVSGSDVLTPEKIDFSGNSLCSYFLFVFSNLRHLFKTYSVSCFLYSQLIHFSVKEARQSGVH